MTYEELLDIKANLEEKLESINDELDNLENLKLKKKFLNKWVRYKVHDYTYYVNIDKLDSDGMGYGKSIVIINDETIQCLPDEAYDLCDCEEYEEVSKKEVIEAVRSIINEVISWE